METDQKKRSVWPTVFAGVVLLSPVLYALSVGPVVGIAIRNESYLNDSRWVGINNSYAPLGSFYRPLGSVAHATGRFKLVGAYVDWWIRLLA